MDINKIFELMEKNNINQESIFELVQEARTKDLNDEAEIRKLISKARSISNKNIDEEKENKMVELIKEKGITPELLDLL